MNFKRYHVSKNLFDANNADYSNFYVATGDVIGSAPDVRSIVIPCEPNTTYTLSKMLSNRFSISTLNAYPTFGMSFTGNRVTDHSATTLTIATGSNDVYLLVMIEYAPTEQDPTQEEIAATIMLNTGSSPLPYEPYSSEVWHDTHHYIHNTSTDTITTPADIYANDTTATVGLKGQTQQNGTPTPTNPIQPSECGERTGNLLNPVIIENGYNINTSGNIIVDNRRIATTQPIDVTSENTVTITYSYEGSTINCIYAIFSGNTMVDRYASAMSGTSIDVSGGDKLYLCWYRGSETITKDDISNLMLNTGSTALPYEPYGVKIPILCGSRTTNVYLGEVQSTRRIKKLVLTGQENWNMRTDDTHIFYLVVSGMRTFSLCAASHYKFVTASIPANLNSGEITTYLGQGVAIWTKNDGIESVNDYKYWLSQQYANGTPVTVWYVLATPETATINEPLMKIGDYADEISGISIPTIAGANTLSIGTTLQPSEVTATYKGWHPVTDVHERENGAWE